MYSRDDLFLRSLKCYFGVYLINTKNNSLASTETFRHSSTYIIYIHWQTHCNIHHTNTSWSLLWLWKNIHYLLWNRGAWCSLNITYQTFLAPCIRCTNHVCDSCALIDINQHFYSVTAPDDFKMLTYCDVMDTWVSRWKLWRHNDQLFS